MHPGKVYLVGGGVPLAVDGVQVGAVGVAGQPQGSDDMAARAGVAAWESFRASGERQRSLGSGQQDKNNENRKLDCSQNSEKDCSLS